MIQLCILKSNGSELFSTSTTGKQLIVFDIEQFGQENLSTNIYILYYLTDEGHYEFFAEVGDDARMNELLSDGEEEEQEEQV